MSDPFTRLLAAGLAMSSASAATARDVGSPPAPQAVCDPAGSDHADTPSGAACRLADELDKAFVYPAQGAAYATMLRANVAAGRYADQSPKDAARMMTADLQAVAPDGHLRVEKEDERRQPGGNAAGKDHPPVLERGGWIAPGIAFLRINAFLPNDQETADVAKFMADHADAEAIIFDLRTHGGGGLAQMDVIFPWLFDKEKRLVTMAMRRSVEEEHGTPFGDGPSMRKLAGTAQETVWEHWALPNEDPRLRDARIILLTSERTASAAEHFALAMKHTGRARLVGSHTAGANHFGGGVSLGGGLSAFIPIGRTYDPLTGKDWEGTGVLPDLECPPERALEYALRSLGVAPEEAAALEAEYMPDPERMKRRRPA